MDPPAQRRKKFFKGKRVLPKLQESSSVTAQRSSN
jgi:hypothetical protein